MRRRVVLIVAAVLLALAGTGALWAYVAGAEARALSGKEAVEVLVAADAIPAGTSFEEAQQQNLVEVQRYPREWALALREMDRLGAELLLPGHGWPIRRCGPIARPSPLRRPSIGSSSRSSGPARCLRSALPRRSSRPLRSRRRCPG